MGFLILLIIGIVILSSRTATGTATASVLLGTQTKAQQIAGAIRAAIANHGANAQAVLGEARTSIQAINPSLTDMQQFVNDPANTDIVAWLQSVQAAVDPPHVLGQPRLDEHTLPMQPGVF